MNINFTHNPRKIFYMMVLFWVILFVIVMSAIVAFDLQRAEREFIDHANIHYQQASDRAHINESILEGFAAMVSTSHYSDRVRIRSYAQKMLKQYPHIFMFEIVEKVHQDQLMAFSDYYRQTIYPEFEVKAFSYETDRHWQPVKESTYHLPIVFMEPFPIESQKVLGLDLSSNDFFMRSLEKSERLNRSVASDPFKLIEGERAYLIHRPIPASDDEQSYNNKSGAQGGFTVLVILADTLLDRAEIASSGMRVLLYNSTYKSSDRNEYLHLHKGVKVNWLASRLFPFLSMSKVIESQSQPFILLVEQQLGWGIISWVKLALTLLVAIITIGVVTSYARLYYQNEIKRAESTMRLFHLANHDALTGLANRNLLHDRLSHAISQTARQKRQLAVLFMDLKEFKTVNDNYGHDVGDGVLRRTAERLRACVRAGDTIARLGGDEFVLVQENITGQQDINHVVEKIKTGFEHPFDVSSHSIILGISIGSAIYPRDGTDIETLINHADSSMYEDKRSME